MDERELDVLIDGYIDGRLDDEQSRTLVRMIEDGGEEWGAVRKGLEIRGSIQSVVRLRTSGRSQQSHLLVVMQRAHADARHARDFTDLEGRRRPDVVGRSGMCRGMSRLTHDASLDHDVT